MTDSDKLIKAHETKKITHAQLATDGVLPPTKTHETTDSVVFWNSASLESGRLCVFFHLCFYVIAEKDGFKLAKFLVALEELRIWQALCFFGKVRNLAELLRALVHE